MLPICAILVHVFYFVLVKLTLKYFNLVVIKVAHLKHLCPLVAKVVIPLIVWNLRLIFVITFLKGILRVAGFQLRA